MDKTITMKATTTGYDVTVDKKLMHFDTQKEAIEYLMSLPSYNTEDKD